MKSIFKFGFLFIFFLFPKNEVKASTAITPLTLQFEKDTAQYALSPIEQDGVLYVSLAEFSDILGFGRFFNPKNKKMVVRMGNRAVKISAFNPFVMVDETARQMPLPALEIRNELYVPLGIFLETLLGDFPYQYTFQPEKRILTLWKIQYNIESYTLEHKKNGLVIRLHTLHTFHPNEVAVALTQGWLHVTVYGGTLDTLAIFSNTPSGTVQKVLSYQFEHSAQISFFLTRQIQQKKVTCFSNMVEISLWYSESVPPVKVQAPVLPDVKNKWLIDVIVIDPGHGGKDPGAIGPSGTKEKEITLALAKRLKKLLESRLPNTRIELTRTSDTFVELEKRRQFANKMGAKLYISIHVNANRQRSLRGFSTYVLGVAKTKEAIEVAQKENSIVEFEKASDTYAEFQATEYILNAIAQNMFFKESQDLASETNTAVKQYTNMSVERGVHQAGFFVLLGLNMPAVLVEAGYISNPAEEKLLKTHTFQQKIAEALCQGIVKFKKQCELVIK